MLECRLLEEVFPTVIPDLSADRYKGQYGKIGLIGGSKEYTGAPYFASISSIKTGSDLVYVFCTTDSAGPIKAYSPELIVVPLLDCEDSVSSITHYLTRLHTLIIGPGLGRDDGITQTILTIIEKARELDLALILDADSLYFLCKGIHLIQDYKKVILTPNAIEFSRLHKTVFDRDLTECEIFYPGERVKQMCIKLGNITIIRKGKLDFISDGSMLVSCAQLGSYRRCGGQGDLLVGSLGTFFFWTHSNKVLATTLYKSTKLNPCMVAAYAACLFTRKCNKLAFDQLGRTMVTTDMIQMIPKAFESLWPTKFRE